MPIFEREKKEDVNQTRDKVAEMGGHCNHSEDIIK